MIEALTLKAACNEVLHKLRPSMPIYGSDTTGALQRPSFYTEIIPYILEYETINLVHQRMGFKISLMEEVTDEVFELTLLAEIRQAFGLKLAVADRKLTISGVEAEYTGAKNDVFQITVTIEWTDSIAEPDGHELIQDIQLRETLNHNE